MLVFDALASHFVGKELRIVIFAEIKGKRWILETKKKVMSFDIDYTEKLFSYGCTFLRGKLKVKLSGASAKTIFRIIYANGYNLLWFFQD